MSLDKSLVHKLIGSMKELFRSGEGKYKYMEILLLHCICVYIVYGNNMRTNAEDLIKVGTTISTTETVLGKSRARLITVTCINVHASSQGDCAMIVAPLFVCVCVLMFHVFVYISPVKLHASS